MKNRMKTVFFVLGTVLIYSTTLSANPDLNGVVSGDASVEENGATYNIHQNSGSLIAEFNSFNIAAHETTNVYQPSSSSAALFKIYDQDPTQILGALNANGKLFLTNPNGIFFAPGSQVNVGSLVASTLDIANEDFLSGNYEFSAADNSGLILNQGNLKAEAGGYVALLGRAVRNEGHIRADGGSAVLAAGDEVTLSLDSEGLVSVAVTAPVDSPVYDLEGNQIQGAIANPGVIEASGGRVVLSAGAAADIFDTVINHEGMISATSSVERNGEIFLVGGDEGIVSVSGTLDASGLESGETGGTVHVLGEKVGLMEGAAINASGDSGGGTVLVGGDFQGNNPEIPNAKRVYVDSESAIHADAVKNGDGGKVIVWADERTSFGGLITARGGSESGDGGFAEVSATDLSYQGFTDLRASNGEKGTLLLDPKNIIVDNAGGSAIAANDTFAENAGADATFLNTAVAAALDGANLMLQANNDITISNNIDASGNTGTGNLTLQAGRSIAMNADVTLRGSFTAVANHASADDGNRDAGDAAFTMGAARIINTSNQNGAISITYGNGPATNNTVGAMTVGQLNSGNGAVTLNSNDNNEFENLDLDGQINSGAISLTGNTVRFDANITTVNSGGLTVTNNNVTDGTAGVTLNLDGAFTQNGANNNNILYSIVTTDDDINFLRPMNLFADVLMSTGAGGGGNIIFQGAINNAQNFQLTAGTGNITFQSAVGVGAALTSILINSAGNVEFDSTVQTTGTITQTTGSGTTNFDNTVTAGGNLNISNDAITFTTAGNIAAGANSVRLNAETGAITGGTAATDITAASVDLDAVTGIGSAGNTLQLITTTMNIDNSGAGNVHVTNAPTANATANTLTTGTGSVTYSQTGNRTLLVTTATAGGAISVTNNGGGATDIAVDNVNAGTNTVTINSGRDILESGADAGMDITGGTVNLTAANDIGTVGNPLEVSATVLNATAGGAANISQTAAALVTGTFAVSVNSSFGGGEMSATNLTVTGSNNSIRLVSTAGGMFLKSVVAQDGTVTVQAAGNITGAGEGGADITGKNEVWLTAGGLIGTASRPLQVHVTGSHIFISSGTQENGLSVNVLGNEIRENVVFLNLPPGLVLYNYSILGGGNYEQVDTAMSSRYMDIWDLHDFQTSYEHPGFLAKFLEPLIDDSALTKPA